MKADVHPSYTAIEITCRCGNSFHTHSTMNKKELAIEVCSNCHPFYTGKNTQVNTSGRVDKFNKRYSRTTAASESDKG